MAKRATPKRPGNKDLQRRVNNAIKKANTTGNTGLLASASLDEAWQDTLLKADVIDNKYIGLADIPAHVYFAAEAVSNSRLNLAALSLAHYRHTQFKEETKSLALGSFIHHGVLEPATIKEAYCVVPKAQIIHDLKELGLDHDPKTKEPYKNITATKVYKERVAHFLADPKNHGKQPVSEEWLTTIVGLITSLATLDLNKNFANGKAEVSMFWIDPTTKLRCKGRIDFLSFTDDGWPIHVTDVKTTRDASDWTLDKWGYHRQAAFYLAGLNTLFPNNPYPITFDFLVTEVKPPFSPRVAPIGQDSLEIGQREIEELLSRVAEAHATDHWPGYDTPKSWEVSDYYRREATRVQYRAVEDMVELPGQE